MSWDRATTGRLAVVVVVLALAYALALWQPVRAWYSDVDKLAHALVFGGVYLGLAWALRWPALPLALLSLALGAAVEAHQHVLPGFSPSVADWLADAAGIGLAAMCQGAWRGWVSSSSAAATAAAVPTATADNRAP